MSLSSNCLALLLSAECLIRQVQKLLAFAEAGGHFGNEVAAPVVFLGIGDGTFFLFDKTVVGL
jgi:hypothetical protein